MKASEAKLNVQNYQRNINNHLDYSELFDKIASVSSSGQTVLHEYAKYIKTDQGHPLPTFAYGKVHSHLTDLGYRLIDAVDQFDTDCISWQ
jgi:hypothetical protein